MTEIVTLTLNPALDKSSTVDHVVPEDKMRCARPQFEPGGGGINVARAIHKLGGTARAVYLCGGPTGETVRQLLQEEGVEQVSVPCAGWTRENLTIWEGVSGRQYRFGMPGPEMSGEEWRRCHETLTELAPPPRFLVVSGSLPPGAPDDLFPRLARLCTATGARLVVDTSGPSLQEAVAAGAFLVKPNLRELTDLRGRETLEEGELAAELATLLDESEVEAVVVSLGAGGALLAHEGGIYRLSSPTVPIRSKVGAGDSMVGGLVLGLFRGLTLIEAAGFGVAAGAAAVMTPGSELCRREDAERLYPRILSQKVS